MADPCCGNCMYFVPRERIARNADALPDGFGECRRRAPSGIQVHSTLPSSEDGPSVYHLAVVYAFPPVPPQDWCGEREPAPYCPSDPVGDGDQG